MRITTTPDTTGFETFYKDVRGRLLLQTWALTGDLPAAQKAVRDALAASWQHWRKVGRLHDPESYVRPQAWARALRRHTARPFHKDREVDEGVQQTLTALGKLPLVQRKVLLLAHLTRLPLDQMAREVGLPQARAESELQSATTAFALARGIDSTSIRSVFDPMAAVVAAVSWPRTSIVTRHGSTRRRTQTLLGIAAAIVVMAGAGGVVSNDADARPRLDSLALSAPESSTPPAPPAQLEPDDLLTADQVSSRLAGRWRVDLTSDNASGDGLLLPCQRQRYADKRVQRALIRTFAGRGGTIGQATEVSATEQSSQAAYRAALSWYAGCSENRYQLMSTQRVDAVGDEAAMVVLRDWNPPSRAIAVGVARTGQLTTTVAATLPPRGLQDESGFTQLLADAVNSVCALPGAGTCANAPKPTEIAPLPIGRHPAFLDEVDLPPVTGTRQPWSSGRVRAATAQPTTAATQCDRTVFRGGGVQQGMTKSFVILGAGLPPQFGIGQAVGAMRTEKAAAAFVQQVRQKLASCQRRMLGTDVEQIETSSSKRADLTSWKVTVEISDASSVVFQMAIVRNGRAVSQIAFVPAGKVQMAPDDFSAMVHRAHQRLAHLG